MNSSCPNFRIVTFFRNIFFYRRFFFILVNINRMAADIFAAITFPIFFLYEDGMSHRQIVRGGIFDRSIF